MNYRIFVEKKSGFNFESIRLFEELKEDFNLKDLEGVRILNVYDIFNIDKEQLDKSKRSIFSEIVTDNVFENFEANGNRYFAFEYLPGQFDQRASSAMECLNLLSDKNRDVVVTSGKVIILQGKVSDEEFEKIKRYMINEVEAREKNLDVLQFEEISKKKIESIKVVEDFIFLDRFGLSTLREKYNLAMSFEDLQLIQSYYKKEKRNPTETEIRVFDTYWSDHCRHTTFETSLEDISFPKGKMGNILEESFKEYLELREKVYGEKAKTRKISLMDMSTIMGKYFRKTGKLDDLEVSDEINACSIYIDVNIDGKIEKWLLMFKNETHNHPTEIEPFGGAATCLGGAIRDPLSGRAYVYQAIRVTGASNPLEKIEETLDGKLPQKKITVGASNGYSSYGNQIGLSTSHVCEIYHEGYKAKRMEVGAVVGAVPASWVRREKPLPGDLVILLGGRTGRDGIGGATGSSKEHTSDSIFLCGAEVQKGNAPEERKIQRLFRNEKVTKLIKKCNDFGAGGVSVAVGELADGLEIDLDKVPTKYSGLDGTELAISESQERMAVVIEAKDKDLFVRYANLENLNAIVIAKVTEQKRLVMTWKGKKIVDIAREFLDTNGAIQKENVELNSIDIKDNPFIQKETNKKIKEKWYEMLSDLNVASQKGLMEKFDSTIGGGTVLMPFGGRYQMTPTELSIHKLPVLEGQTTTASGISWGYNPYISSWSQYHGGIYSVVESITKIVAAGGDYKTIRLSFQEYFEKLGNNPKKWGKPFAALLGTIYAQKRFSIPAIGGKDSMSGTFHKLSVPPTLISFAVGILDTKDVISNEFKNPKNRVYLIKSQMDENLIPNIDTLKDNFELVHKLIKDKKIISAMSVTNGGIAETLSKMSFGNRIGVDLRGLSTEIKNNLFNLCYGSIIVETKEEISLSNENIFYLGETIEDYKIILDDETIEMEEGERIWLEKLAPVFPYKLKEEIKNYDLKLYKSNDDFSAKEENKCKKPKVLIPVFPGTNCEYDCYRAFEKAGGAPKIIVFRNNIDIEDSIKEFITELQDSNILMLAGGFSAGDEPDGSGKFIANILRNRDVFEAITKFRKRDGLILGICNGFQALIKSGLLPYGDIEKLDENSPTLSFNKIGRHISQMVKTKIVSNNSPWLKGMELGKEYTIPVSHGEGRFVASDEVIEKLFANGQVVTQYVNFDGEPTNEFRFNPNGSSFAIEGIVSEDGRIFGKMGHSERYGEDICKNIIGDKLQDIFKNGINYFK